MSKSRNEMDTSDNNRWIKETKSTWPSGIHEFKTVQLLSLPTSLETIIKLKPLNLQEVNSHSLDLGRNLDGSNVSDIDVENLNDSCIPVGVVIIGIRQEEHYVGMRCRINRVLLAPEVVHGVVDT